MRIGDSIQAYQYIGPGDDCLQSLDGTSDGGVVASGYFTGLPVRNATVVKLDSTGALSWLRVVNVRPAISGRSVEQTRDGGYVTVGYGHDSIGAPYFLHPVRLTAAGDSEWVRPYGETFHLLDYSVHETHDSGFVLTGPSSSPSGLVGVACIMRTDKHGDSLWTRRYEMEGFRCDSYAGHETRDHGFIIAGWMTTGSFPWPLLPIRTDSLGDTLWTRRLLPWFANCACAEDVM